jgi:serine-type D-Ala-D-Ala carboxypeptidase (penicillin-binding protein 5/6)
MKDSLISFLKKKKRYVLYTLISLCLLILLCGAFLDVFLRYYVFEKNVRELPFKVTSEQYPVFKIPITPDISAKAVVVMDKDSKTVLFSKNPNLLFSMASTTKIMTALVALDHYKLNDVLTIKTEGVEGVNVGFKVDEKLFFKDVLYAMLLPSGNDAALAIAQNYPGGEKAFVEKMNEKAKLFHLTHTNFADSIGLEDSRDYTTPLDLARLASMALNNDTFAKIVSTRNWKIADVTGVNEYLLTNLNKLLGAQGVNGIKTGYTTEAGQVLVTSKKEGEKTLIIVVMDSQDRFFDTSILLNSISDNVNYLSIHP